MKKYSAAFIWLVAFPLLLTFSFGWEVIAMCWTELVGKVKAII